MEAKNTTPENNFNQADQLDNQTNILKQKGYLPLGLGIILLVLVVGAGAYYLGSVKNRPQTQNPVVNSQTVQPISSPTSTPDSIGVNTLPIPKDGDWIKYQPQCKSLKDNLEIYYPNNWLPSEVVDNRPILNGEVCTLNIDYPQHEVMQDNRVVSEPIATIKVTTFDISGESLDQYLVAIEKQDPKPISITKVIVNGVNFTRLDFSDHIMPLLYTTKNNRVFRINLINKTGYRGNNVDQATTLDSSVDVINGEFIKRMKINSN